MYRREAEQLRRPVTELVWTAHEWADLVLEASGAWSTFASSPKHFGAVDQTKGTRHLLLLGAGDTKLSRGRHEKFYVARGNRVLVA